MNYIVTNFVCTAICISFTSNFLLDALNINKFIIRSCYIIKYCLFSYLFIHYSEGNSFRQFIFNNRFRSVFSLQHSADAPVVSQLRLTTNILGIPFVLQILFQSQNYYTIRLSKYLNQSHQASFLHNGRLWQSDETLWGVYEPF